MSYFTQDSDDTTKAQHDNHKSEQDALKNLLESLENKRKTLKEKEDDNLIMKHGSVHQRIADARKRFADVSDSNTSHQPGGKYTSFLEAVVLQCRGRKVGIAKQLLWLSWKSLEVRIHIYELQERS